MTDWGDDDFEEGKNMGATMTDAEALKAAKGEESAIPDVKQVEKIAGDVGTKAAQESVSRELTAREWENQVASVCEADGLDDEETTEITEKVFRSLGSDEKFKTAKGVRAANNRVKELAKEIVDKKRAKYGGKPAADAKELLGQGGKKGRDDDESLTRDTKDDVEEDPDQPFFDVPSFEGRKAPTTGDLMRAEQKDMKDFAKRHK